MIRLFAALRRSTIITCISLMHTGAVLAEGNEYLKYQEPKPQVSLLSSIDTVLYMITVFALILGLAYFASRFIGTRMKSNQIGSHGDAVLSLLTLGPNKGIYLVQFAGRLLILSVSDQRVELLADMTDAPDAADLRETYQTGLKPMVAPQFSAVFDSQLASLRQMSQKFPRVFGQDDESPKSEHEKEKR
jgi:flagellar protein FliO/FliZ